MSHQNNTRISEEVRADFEQFIRERKWSDAEALLDNLWDTGFKRESIILQKFLISEKMNVNNLDETAVEPKDPWEAEQERGVEIDAQTYSHADVW